MHYRIRGPYKRPRLAKRLQQTYLVVIVLSLALFAPVTVANLLQSAMSAPDGNLLTFCGYIAYICVVSPFLGSTAGRRCWEINEHFDKFDLTLLQVDDQGEDLDNAGLGYRKCHVDLVVTRGTGRAMRSQMEWVDVSLNPNSSEVLVQAVSSEYLREKIEISDGGNGSLNFRYTH